ncbi:RNA polymerase sigma-70 factor (sigma-E family) [Actinokineospora baliensis]|uniref:SigE family RNA polymerase sigma factor n=1 Tax=Actinokineospora baliensis TaxID=547056 RepID=UPI0019588F58|nr:SigE family RNA polymerase sigma factor [Actinokineospora baliensis]MBM7774037.1 RNA polymerase sigma-70 factor (sigma-E family) [Actinokineospora baliensis]
MDRLEFGSTVRGRLLRWRRIAFLVCGDWRSAEDVVQVALLRLYRHWHRIESAGLDAYARRVIVRLAVDEASHRRRRGEVLDGVPERPVDAVATEEVLAVRSALREIPPRQRAVLVLRFYGDLSVAETATTLGISAGTVKSQCARGLSALRALLSEPAAEQREEERLG